MPKVTEARIERFRSEILLWAALRGRHALPWRRRSATRYKKIIAEMLLQRTRAETGEPFFASFVKRFPSWKVLASARRKELETHLKPIGLWRRRAESMKALATEMSKRKGRFPAERREIEELPGVGQYIANAIMLLCRGQPEPLLDVNMARVLERYFGPRRLADIRFDPELQALARRVVAGHKSLALNWAFLDFASAVCTSRAPKCHVCPAAGGCRFARQPR